jgi:hypothetical protein
MTNFVRKSLHSRTAVYFADGLHNPRKYALKFYADPQACAAERDAYRELQGEVLPVQLLMCCLNLSSGASALATSLSTPSLVSGSLLSTPPFLQLLCNLQRHICFAMHLACIATLWPICLWIDKKAV